MLLRLVLLLCLVLQPAMGWARPAPPPDCAPIGSCCTVEMAGGAVCQPCRPGNPCPVRPGAGVETARLLSAGPRLERASPREIPEPYRGPVARKFDTSIRPVRAERPARPGRVQRSFLCVWVI